MSLFLDNISLLLMYFIHMLSRLSYVRLSVTLWTVACQAPLSMGFSRQEYWSGLPCPPSGNLPHPGTEPISLTSPALAGGFFTTGTTWAKTEQHEDSLESQIFNLIFIYRRLDLAKSLNFFLSLNFFVCTT